MPSQADLDAASARRGQGIELNPFPLASALDGLKGLRHAGRDVLHLCQRQLLYTRRMVSQVTCPSGEYEKRRDSRPMQILGPPLKGR